MKLDLGKLVIECGGEVWAGPSYHTDSIDIERFAALVLEEAAKACEAIDPRSTYTDTDLDDAYGFGALRCAHEIRALIDQKPPEAG